MPIPVVDRVVAFISWCARTAIDALNGRDAKQNLIFNIKTAVLQDEADMYFNNANAELKADPEVVAAYGNKTTEIKDRGDILLGPFLNLIGNTATDFLSTDINNLDPLATEINKALEKWKTSAEGFQNTSAEDAQKKLAALTGKTIQIFGISAGIDLALGMLPNGAGEASSMNTKRLLAMLGFGAVAAAAFHDPVKIGILRPYQDNLEATFRNRRPEYVGILNAYKQRSLSTIPVQNTDEITDEVMDQIEIDNNKNMDDYGAQWGYPEKWITIEKDASTKAMTFGNLMAMARLGYYDRGMSIFSLWTYGLDRRLMKNALKAIETSRDVGMWKGFRSMVEPSYVQGLIEESDLTEYWSKILVPPDVQSWALLRLRNSRAKFAAKELKLQEAASKDLTKSDWMQAYQAGIISVDEFESKLRSLGYDENEISILVKLAEEKKTGPTSSTMTHLSLSDYEKAHIDGIISADQVLARMVGEYAPEDIEIEKQFLAYDDLAAETIPAERDLTVSQLRDAWIEDIISLDKFKESLALLGFDAEEVDILLKISEVKKDLASAQPKTSSTISGLTAERDLTLSQLTAAYVQNVIDETTYTADLAALGYDAQEISILIKLAQIKKKIPSVEGLKRLPLGDYEKAWKYGQLTSDQVIDRMRGEYREEDIQLERLLLTIGKP